MGPLLLGKPSSNITLCVFDIHRTFVRRNLKQIQVEGCRPYICAQLYFSVNFALATIYYYSAYQHYESCYICNQLHFSVNFALAAKYYSSAYQLYELL